MRRDLAVAGLLTAGILATGCRTRFFQVSVHPFFEATDAPGDVAGRWVLEGEDGEGIELEPAGENEWRVDIFEAKDGEGEDKDSGVVVRFGRVGGVLYWDMTAAESDSAGDLAEEHLLGLHSVARVRVDGDTMEIAFLNPYWVAKAIEEGTVELAHFREDEDHRSVVLTAPTKELEAFLQAHGDAPEVFSEPEVYHRVQ